MTDIKAAFAEMTEPDSYRRVDADHILDLYYGLDTMGRYTFLLISSQAAKDIASSRLISISQGKRKDGTWALAFSLLDEKYCELFFLLCTDIIDSSRSLKNKSSGVRFVAARYRQWQQMLAASTANLLSRNEVKGLIGEMLYLRDYLFPAFGQELALKAWMGPDMADQDFVFTDTWSEVKATVSGAECVHISSVEQLDTAQPGTLAVLYLDTTSEMDEQHITINSIYHEILELLQDDDIRIQFSQKLFAARYYPREEYEEQCYRWSGIACYKVNEKFPCLRRADIPQSIVNVTYTLSLSAIAPWKKEL